MEWERFARVLDDVACAYKRGIEQKSKFKCPTIFSMEWERFRARVLDTSLARADAEFVFECITEYICYICCTNSKLTFSRDT